MFYYLLMFSIISSVGCQYFDFDHYHDYPEIEQYIRSVARENPQIASLRTIGVSNEGRKLIGLKIGTPSHNTDKPAVYLDGGNHGREWPAFHTALYVINELVTGYNQRDPLIIKYLEKLNFYVFPVLNPDGFIFSRTSKSAFIRQWRKNRSLANCTGITAYNKKNVCCEGVDLNRNFPIEFKSTNYPFNNPCSDEYQGPYPFSEPEARAFRDFFLSPEAQHIHAYLSFHTHGQLFILPYNYRRRVYPSDYTDLLNLARKAADAISAHHGTEYRVGTAADMLGPVTGSAADWVKKNTFIKYVFTMELPPELKTSFAFQIRDHWLVPIGKETWIGAKVIIDQVIREFAQ